MGLDGGHGYLSDLLEMVWLVVLRNESEDAKR